MKVTKVLSYESRDTSNPLGDLPTKLLRMRRLDEKNVKEGLVWSMKQKAPEVTRRELGEQCLELFSRRLKICII